MARLEGFKRLAPVENQLRMTVRDYALHTFFAVMFQNPKAMDEAAELRRGCDLTIPNHISMIAGQMPNWRK
jgi:hypothetical protein